MRTVDQVVKDLSNARKELETAGQRVKQFENEIREIYEAVGIEMQKINGSVA